MDWRSGPDLRKCRFGMQSFQRNFPTSGGSSLRSSSVSRAKGPPEACVWMLDPYRLNLLSFYPSDDSFGVALPDWDQAKEYVPENYCGEKLLRQHPLAIDPPHFFRRLSSQQSHFTVFGTKVDGLAELAGEKNNGEIKNPCLLEKITIPAEAVPDAAGPLSGR